MIDISHGDSLVYLNGEYLPLAEAKISVLDRGFIFGDGIYEVVPVYNGKPFRFDQHVARLQRSLAAIGLETGKSAEDWIALMSAMIERSPWPYHMVYLQVTRGVAKRDHGFPNPPVAPTIFMMNTPFQRPSAEKLAKGLSTIAMDDLRWLHCDIKTTSLLGNVLAKQYALSKGVDDVIMFRNGFLSEASSSNIWLVKDGKVAAPLRNNLILEGVRYGFIEQLCQEEGIAFESRNITEDEIAEADEILITAATKEVQAITSFNGQPVGDGKPGPVFWTLRKAYDRVLEQL
ncbi:D-amino acid aminotransferase [Brackiella oedipodis]|uniref:D-amino acid aminotransferase n=1 Tax=Brackiella oedipodis TaxID=124225 RepID=UPI00048C46C3|nr:D-amino acid aminotransferase [Brackiella oedipodis]